MEDKPTFRTISREDLISKYNDHLFWCVFDEKRKQVVASPNMNGMEDLGYAFVDRADAESLKYILTKTPAYQDDHQFRVVSDKWPDIDAACAATLGEFCWVGIEPDQAKILFEYIRKDLPLSEAEEQELGDLPDRYPRENY
jgi:hypothetical protein